jgi:predicted metal-binding membrane protein
MSATVEQALVRHRAISLAALAVLTLLAWAWLALGAGTAMAPSFSLTPIGTDGGASYMPGMAMPGMDMPAQSPWPLEQAALTFSMWWIMMVAMMLPSAAPTILLYARVASTAQVQPASGSFLAGYLLAWGGFSSAATVAQLMLRQVGLLAPDGMASQSRVLSGAIFVAVGLYQLSPLKNACLRHCRAPTQFLTRHFRPGTLGAMRMGGLHGAICVGCCWLLMVLLFVGGVMNLAWIALLTIMVAAEKLLPFGRWLAILSGVGCLAVGAWLLL